MSRLVRLPAGLGPGTLVLVMARGPHHTGAVAARRVVRAACCALVAVAPWPGCGASSSAGVPSDPCAAVEWIAEHHAAITSLDAEIKHTFIALRPFPQRVDVVMRLVLDRSGGILWEAETGGIRGTDGDIVGHGDGAVGEGDDYVRGAMTLPSALRLLTDGERVRSLTCAPAPNAFAVAHQVAIDLTGTRADGRAERARVHVLADGPLRGRVVTIQLHGSWWKRTFHFASEHTVVSPELPDDVFVYYPGPGAIDRTAEHHPAP